MKTAIRPLLGLIFVLAAAAATNAHAHGVRFGFHFGVPLFPPAWYYPPPVYYYPAPVVSVPAAPPVYIEPPQAQSAPAQQQWWYYCADSKTYYPYVQSCASEWQRVSPRPPGS